jgi:DNA-binding CsgD family transcriptional regulator/tetratricopeptide (TPR) repeat protein
MTEVMGHLARSARTERVGLPPLSLAAVTRLAEGHDVEPARVHAVTAGNAFFVTEVLASEGVEVPDSVRDSVVGRAAALSAGARAALETAAVVPDRVELDLLRSVSGAANADLEECERADLLEIGTRVATYRHELARNAVLDSLAAARRRELHAAVVAHLLTLSGHHEARIAHHADLAGDAATVLTYAVIAADQAARMGSHHEAAAQMDRAIAHLDVAEPDRAAGILGRAALLYQSTGRMEEALDAAHQAVRLRREQDDVDLAVQLATLSRMLWVLARGEEARAAIDEAVQLITERPGSPGEVMVLSTDSSLSMLAREIPRSLETGRRAVALARERSDSAALVRALNAVGTASWFAVPDEAEPLLVESLRTAERLRDDIGVAAAMINLGSGAGEVRRYNTALRWLEEGRRFCAERDLDHSRDYATSWVARIDLEQGRWDSALARAERLLLGTDPISRIGALTVAAKIHARRGEGGATELLDGAWAEAQRSGHLQRLWPVAAGRAEVAWSAGHPERLLEVVEETLALAVRLDQPWAVGELGWWSVRVGGPAPDGTAAAPYAAMIAGDWKRAADLWAKLGCPWEEALALGETDDAEALERASAALHRLGARPDAARVAQRMRGLGLTAARPRRTTAANPAGLTDRELEVARLLGEGATNADIGKALFISPRTAAHHVSAVLGKLGVTNRREAARTVAAWKS